MLSKNVNNKKCAPKLIFFNEKKIEKDLDNFWYRKLTLNVKRLVDFALFDTSPLTQFSKFNNFLWLCWFLGKNISNFAPPIWISTTRIAITSTNIFHCAIRLQFECGKWFTPWKYLQQRETTIWQVIYCLLIFS